MFFAPEASRKAEEEDLMLAVAAAKKEWQLANLHFNHVTEPDRIDEAVHRCLAAERRFANLLKKLKSQENTCRLVLP